MQIFTAYENLKRLKSTTLVKSCFIKHYYLKRIFVQYQFVIKQIKYNYLDYVNSYHMCIVKVDQNNNKY